MAIRVVMAGATGWVGKALVPAIGAQADMALAGAVSRSGAGQDSGLLVGMPANGVTVSASLAEALEVPSDVLVDYTKPHVVKDHALHAISKGRHVVIGTSGLGAADYVDIDAAARANKVGVIAAGNFSITATLMKRFALMAAKYVPDVEVIDYASAKKPDAPSGTARELAEALADVRKASTARPVAEVSGVPGTRGAAVGAGQGVQVHALRLPSYILSCEALFGLPDERLTIRHDAGSSAAPYVAGTLLAIRRVQEVTGLVRGLDALMD
ncbi:MULTISPECIES: 4-hydroxy-tetrahydrodipicolinate reductase [unclassified Mesorhizobium]|uniref:4-hydroxy-tetrahydrodipicolinate reductase n=1 Tax=unclassified Mesorhizobium TaxID=325217 RepID=UPI000FDC2D9E|nr:MULTISPECIES: 4-hydroxy-tetrahydrodipicolinate reductase [unclassified Mesorhizobium]TGQ47696.1 4-hydroxy-tetrahydrodipicolinate reductase [Mesorhizobium sp. M00.F.Ca.ET.216.01.1.1]TIS58721.1 MAG: 4-hydroxy-tetrahydrodipicolinate reductase [Mesorhizobium sp.]TIS92264.1 MAG: 4-hydroxy-tetrahydrodipicolinate reductase [Mesorhizobium sp.]TJW18034.1 MAG: 4-hydroxy-tetrahydrodipicolinate reductase [Mesorhizobium sp.]TJW40571.1 MAG: 4-hydroxy-tetrahydrodipicolinate reductase [Mesorhizobium sp.]